MNRVAQPGHNAHTRRDPAEGNDKPSSWMGSMSQPRMGLNVITLTRFHGERFSVNPDMIVRADATPDTVITLIDGTKLLVAESLDDLNAIVLLHRSSIVSQALGIAGSASETTLATVTGLASRSHLHLTPEAD